MSVQANLDSKKSANSDAIETAISYAEEFSKKNNPYVWGGKGEALTTANINVLDKRYKGDKNAGYSHLRSGGKYFHTVGKAGYKCYDCSGLTYDAFKAAGVIIGHGSINQHDKWKHKQVPMSQAKPGDLLWRSGHVGIVGRKGLMIEARGRSYGVVETQKPSVMTKALRVLGEGGGAVQNTSSSGGLLTNAQVQAAITYNKKNSQSLAKAIQALVGVTQDGSFGPITCQAIAKWQKANGLVADGQFGPKSKAKANLGASNTSNNTTVNKPANNTTPTKTAKLTNAQVQAAIKYNKANSQSMAKQIQKLVGVTQDGSFGPITVQAIAQWQASNGLVADGQFGPKSKAKANLGASNTSNNTTVNKPANNTTPTKPAPTAKLTDAQVKTAINYNKNNNQSIAKKIQKLVGVTQDGSFGPITVQAIAQWQASNGLVADGQFGPKSKAKANFPATNPQDNVKPSGNSNLTPLNTKQVAARETGRKSKQVVDLTTGKRFNVSWDSSPNYHTDFTPMTASDTTVLKSILNASKVSDNNYWTKTSSWSWNGRPGAIQLKDGTWVACGFHLRPHAAIMGGSPGSPFKNQSNTRPASGWALGGHMCMYYGDSPGGTPSCNDAAKRARSMRV